MINQDAEKYIHRCIELAKKGLGSTSPNPMVGSVIVHKGKIIGEGYHKKCGEAHAEVNAIASVKQESDLQDATLYVNLEPCVHHGKTPPCTDLIIRKGIPRVVISMTDPNPKVAGKGIKKLREHGVEVISGVLEQKAKHLNRRFIRYMTSDRPYIILKWAETKDGFIAPITKDDQKPVWITNLYSRQLVHKWRSEEQAIFVGTKTVLEDNPSLTVRDWTGENPIRVVLDRTSNLKSDFNIFNAEAKTIRISDKDIDFRKPIAIQICTILYKNDINSIIIEGGALTLQTFINEGLWDEARIFIGNVEFTSGLKAPELKWEMTSESKIKNDLLRRYAKD
jgi:diaminohydroxyphosphoribosylaminopyrimidine deaminase/5-amino-6-(5-phosphoribosylamino)uracil reductase